MMIIYLVAAVFLIYYVMNGNGNSVSNNKSPEYILKERFARGEIDEETYNKMMNSIR